MNARNSAQRRTTVNHHALIACSAILFASLVSTGCQSDEPVGHSKTTTKQVIDTPTEKTTVTETHEKDTKLYPR